MTDLDKYMSFPYRMEIVEDKEEGGFVVSYPELPGCISSGETIEKAIANINEAKREWLCAAVENGVKIPMPDKLNKYSGQLRLRMPKSLHRDLAVRAKEEGISMNQYCIYLLSKENREASSKITKC